MERKKCVLGRIASLKRGGRHEIENNRWREQSFSSRYRKPIIRAGAFALIPLMGRQPPSLSLSLSLSTLSSFHRETSVVVDVGRRLNDV